VVHPADAAAVVRRLALAAGFDRAGVATLAPSATGAAFEGWLARGDHAGMGWLERRVEARLEPASLLPGARTAVCVALRYAPLAGEPEATGDLWPRVARYARGDDYHELMTDRLRELEARLTEVFPGVATRRYVDTGPVLERELAARAGLGAIGKNTCLLDRELGSWFLLGEVLTTLDLAPDEPRYSHSPEEPLADLCGGCTLCLQACPTGALPAPYRLDSNRCISYWTIEHRGGLPEAAREMVGDWVFGCDVCQEVCPWNRRRHAIGPAEHPELGLPAKRAALDLAGLLGISRESYVEIFRGSPMKRARHDGLRRNATVAMGNRRDPAYVEPLAATLGGDPDPMLRGHAAWALGRIADGGAAEALAAARLTEADPAVRAEIDAALTASAAPPAATLPVD
jgi:epoxyqueuosine reductase